MYVVLYKYKSPPVACQRFGSSRDRDTWLAAFDGDAAGVRRGLSGGVAADSANAAGLTMMHAAALGGHLEVVRILAEAGADPEAATNGGETPVHVAAANGNLNVRIFFIVLFNFAIYSWHFPACFYTSMSLL